MTKRRRRAAIAPVLPMAGQAWPPPVDPTAGVALEMVVPDAADEANEVLLAAVVAAAPTSEHKA